MRILLAVFLLIARSAAAQPCRKKPGEVPQDRKRRCAAEARLQLTLKKTMKDARVEPALIYGEREKTIKPPEAGPVDVSMPSAPPPAPSVVLARPLPRSRAPLREPPPPPSPRSRALATLAARVDGHGASAASVRGARVLLRAVLADADQKVLDRLVAIGARVEIIPRNKRLTDLPHFAGLAGKKTFDGRPWDRTRGAGNARWADGTGVSCAVSEENLTDAAWTGYPPGFLFVHEFAHLVHLNGLALGGGPDAGPRANDVSLAFRAVLDRAGKTGLGGYADSNSREAFAEAAAAYFGVSDEGITREQLKKRSPELYAVVKSVYGSSRPIARARTLAPVVVTARRAKKKRSCERSCVKR